MSELAYSIRFEHFRGLPNNEFKLDGKSLAILGSNGKGKSAVIDGIEFLFSGRISRFHGSGTGAIDHDDAIQHVKKLGVPKVTLSLRPSKGTITSTLNPHAITVSDPEAVTHYFEQHRGVDGFILRRARILDFVCDQDADRYQKFIKLLGISHIDTLQRCFVDAERQMGENAQRARAAYQTRLAVFRDPVARFEPQSLSQILARISDSVQSQGLEKISKWSDAEIRLQLLKAKRPEANKERIDVLTRALVSLETPLPLDIGADIITANALRQRLTELAASSADAPKSNIITEGVAYFGKYQTDTDCALCERPFDKPLADVLSRLRQRSDALRELRDAVANRRAALVRIQRYGESTAEQLRKDLVHGDLLAAETKQTLRDARAAALRWLRVLKQGESGGNSSDLAATPRLSTLAKSRSECAVSLNAQIKALTPVDSAKLEAAIALLERGIASHVEIESAETTIARAEKLAVRATAAKESFSEARETAIQKVFEHIAETVLGYYRKLHDLDQPNERSECTALELKPTSRAAAGGLRLAIQFLGLSNSKDPRAFLSEGHLDSLGLCLFLAAVRIFNPPGTLLVLDDILTSIDREHRRRVGELLFREFSDYQIIITTHDEHWHDLLSSAARAWGIQGKWTFQKVENWTVDSGPALSVIDSSREFITAHLTESDYRELGGPFRLILEDFLKRTAVKLELKIKYRIDGKYTAGDFAVAGIQDKIRNALIELDPSAKIGISTDVGRVFGQGDLVNFLSHDNPGRLEVTFDQARDFVRGLIDLTKRCEDNKLIKGR